MCLEAVKEDGYAIVYIKNPTEEMYIEAIKQDGTSVKYIKKSDQNFDIVKAFFDYDWGKIEVDQEDYYKYLAKKFIIKEQGLIMIQDNPCSINFLSKNVQREILEIKPELEKYIEEKDDLE